MCTRTFSSVLLASLALLFGCGGEVSVSHEKSSGETSSGEAHDADGHSHDGDGHDHDEGGEHASGDGDGHDDDGHAGHDHGNGAQDGDLGHETQAQAAKLVDEALRKGPGSNASVASSSPNGGERYETGIERKDFGFDLSKVNVKDSKSTTPTPPKADDGHDHEAGDDHAGHDHAVDDAPGGLLPPTVAKGRVAMWEDDSQSHDFGNIRQGDLGHHRFDFVSAGEQPLVINTIKPSCGCTKADIVLLNEDGSEQKYAKGTEIPVGQRFFLEAEITTDGKPAGPFNAQVQLYGNDPRGAFNVRMTAEIQAVLEVKPSMTAFLGRITTAESAEQTVTIRSVGGEDFGLKPNPAGVVEPLQVELIPLNDEDGDRRAAEWEVRLKLGPNIPVGMRYYPVIFESDIAIPHPKFPAKDGETAMYKVQVNVQAQVVGMVHAEPNFVNFGIVRPSTPIERVLQLEVHDDFKLTTDIPITISGYQGQEFPFPDAFETSITPSEDGRTAEVKVNLKGLPEEHAGSFGGMLNIKIGHPNMEELQVRFSGVARQDLRRK